MDGVPNDLMPVIFDFITLITDKRQFLRTCNIINIMTKKLMEEYENNFKIDNFKKRNGYCVEKFTLELCHDKYFHLIPNTYLIPNNKIIVSALATFGNLQLLQIAVENGCKLKVQRPSNNYYTYITKFSKIKDLTKITDTCALAAQYGHQHIIEFCLNNGCELNRLSYLMAINNGHFALADWLLEILKIEI